MEAVSHIIPMLLHIILPLLVAWLLDLWLGDPAWLPHPVVGFGNLIARCERRFNKGIHRLLKGAVTCVALVLLAYIVTDVVLHCAFTLARPAGYTVQTVLLFYCMAGTTLVREVRAVFSVVDRSVEAGRKQVARIVGRDTARLSPQEIRAAALETLAENLSDGVVAPLFWYLLLGVPGMVAYKMVNTLDSMIGYRTGRYRLFGRVAARLDDVANYIPARLTAFLMLLAAGRLSLLSFVKQYGKRHLSPNSGYPEAALAGILDCRFGGPHDYFGSEVWKPYIGGNDRPLTTEDMERAVCVNRRAECVMLLSVVLLQIGFALL
ncbi:MAG: adenosylcobinamide-phosphate synthase CbiB [Prevotellaceae bacterium]|nr:adenosylcobinamide-phosphate synthase CbiB [Prevotellaceae bacterium]